MNLREYLQVVNQHKLLIVVTTLLAGAASFLLSVRETPRYQATSQVLLSTTDLPSLLTNTQNPNTAVQPERVSATQAQLARVPEVARRALADAGVNDRKPSALIGDSSVAADPSSDLLTFTVEDRHPHQAERLATAYARAFIQYRFQIDSAPFAAANQRLTTRLAQLRASGRGHSALAKTLRDRQEQVASFIELQSPDARVVRPATDSTQVRPRPARALAVGLPIGLLLGLVIAVLLHVLDPRARSRSEVERSLDLPPLGWLPTPPRRYRNRLAMLEDPTGSYAEAVAAVRTNIDLARRVQGSQVLLVTPVSGRTPGVKSTAVANLAVAFARAGLQVVLADLDFRQPAIARLFGLEPRWGVTEVLLGQADVQDALRPVPLRPGEPKKRKPSAPNLGTVEFGGTLRVLPVAMLAANPTDVIATRGIGVILEQLRGDADLVLVDAPPWLEGSDAAALSSYVDSVVLIASVGHDRRSELADARRRVASSHATPLGYVGTGRRTGETATSPARPEVFAGMPPEALS
jgi:Mrp family chromosome partitioning ATPase